MHRLRVGDALFLRGGGLGIQGYAVYNTLDTSDGQRRRDIARTTGLRAEQVSPALRRLVEIGAARKGTDGLWYRSFDFDPDAAARKLGLRSKMAARDARMDREAAEHRLAVHEAYERRQTAGERPPAPQERPEQPPDQPIPPRPDRPNEGASTVTTLNHQGLEGVA